MHATLPSRYISFTGIRVINVPSPSITTLPLGKWILPLWKLTGWWIKGRKMNDTSHVKLAPINILSPFEFELSLSFFLSKFLKSLSRADYSIWNGEEEYCSDCFDTESKPRRFLISGDGRWIKVAVRSGPGIWESSRRDTHSLKNCRRYFWCLLMTLFLSNLQEKARFESARSVLLDRS